jgi:PleD family two-component response regulator
LPYIEKLKHDADVMRHCNKFRRTPPGVLMPLSVAEKSVVLVVEENAVFRSATAERLRAAGFEVFEAANSAEAELVLKDTPVDALFVSVRR